MMMPAKIGANDKSCSIAVFIVAANAVAAGVMTKDQAQKFEQEYAAAEKAAKEAILARDKAAKAHKAATVAQASADKKAAEAQTAHDAAKAAVNGTKTTSPPKLAAKSGAAGHTVSLAGAVLIA